MDLHRRGGQYPTFEYLTFTDDSNLANVPIKFAVPPFSFSADQFGPVMSWAIWISATNGFYRGPTNIFDAHGGWSVPTNLVSYATVLDQSNGTFVNVTKRSPADQ